MTTLPLYTRITENSDFVNLTNPPELIALKSPRLQAALQRAEECAARRGITLEDWIADAVEWKNNLEAGPTCDERSQGYANE